MRRVLPGDIFALAHVLTREPRCYWGGTCARIFAEAHSADKFRKRFSKAHKAFGNGSVMGRVGCLPAPLRCSAAFDDPEFCCALSHALDALARWRRFQSGSQAVP
ncbi:DUF7742 family protein [Cognatishimia activa]|uniref:DUF7742 family protein n=1 Tax=Cognatishimia activa TaxID=1715691 RepID=UPI00071D1F43